MSDDARPGCSPGSTSLAQPSERRGDAVTLVGLLELGDTAPRRDPYAAERGAERRFGDDLPLARFMPGYERNADAALALLDLLEQHAKVDAVLAAAVRELAANGNPAQEPPG